MKNILLPFLFLLLAPGSLRAQAISINTDASNPDPSAILDVKSTEKGMLVPRMTTTQRAMIAAPATGLLVFDTNTGGFWFFNGTVWTNLSAGGTPATFVADTDGNTKVQTEKSPDENTIRFDVNGNEAMVIDPTGRVGIGTDAPWQKLDLRGSGTDGAALLSLGNSDRSHHMLIFPGRENDPTPSFIGRAATHCVLPPTRAVGRKK